MADPMLIASLVGSAIGGLVGAGILVERVAGWIRVGLEKRDPAQRPTLPDTPRDALAPPIVVVDSHEDLVLRMRTVERRLRDADEATEKKIKKAAQDAAADSLLALVRAAEAKKGKQGSSKPQPKPPEEPDDGSRPTDPTDP